MTENDMIIANNDREAEEFIRQAAKAVLVIMPTASPEDIMQATTQLIKVCSDLGDYRFGFDQKRIDDIAKQVMRAACKHSNEWFATVTDFTLSLLMADETRDLTDAIKFVNDWFGTSTTYQLGWKCWVCDYCPVHGPEVVVDNEIGRAHRELVRLQMENADLRNRLRSDRSDNVRLREKLRVAYIQNDQLVNKLRKDQIEIGKLLNLLLQAHCQIAELLYEQAMTQAPIEITEITEITVNVSVIEVGCPLVAIDPVVDFMRPGEMASFPFDLPDEVVSMMNQIMGQYPPVRYREHPFAFMGSRREGSEFPWRNELLGNVFGEERPFVGPDFQIGSMAHLIQMLTEEGFFGADTHGSTFSGAVNPLNSMFEQATKAGFEVIPIENLDEFLRTIYGSGFRSSK